MTHKLIEFTVDELWVLQAFIRHASSEQWRDEDYPPFSRPLNDQIAEALAYCDKSGEGSRVLSLTPRDLYAVDYCIPASAKDAAGRMVGREILLKTFHARQPDRGTWLKEWLDANTDASTDDNPNQDGPLDASVAGEKYGPMGDLPAAETGDCQS